MSIEKLYFIACGSLAAFFLPLYVIMLWLLIFVVVDMVTGICAAVKEGKRISSSKLKQTVYKLTMYLVCVTLLHGLDTYMFSFWALHLAEIGAALICSIEFYSILENFYKITEHRVFKVLTHFTAKQVRQHTGINIEVKDGGSVKIQGHPQPIKERTMDYEEDR